MTDDRSARVLDARTSRAARAAVASALAGAMLLAGCASGSSVQQSVSGWFARALGRTPALGEPRVSYAAVDRVKVYSEPDASSPVEGVLNRHEEVSRFQSERGFAYVEAQGNVWGWVPERQLALRLPQARAPDEVEATKPAETTAPSDASPTEASPPPATGAASDAAQTEASPPPATGAASEAAPPPDEGTREPEPSVFDPY